MTVDGSSRNNLPASYLFDQRKDPAEGMKGTPSNFGQEFLQHIHTINGRYGLVSHSYLNYDEALADSRDNAYRMRADCGIMESLEARQRATALLKWTVEAEDASDPEAVELATVMSDVLRKTPRFVEMRRSLLEALWFGRSMTTAQFAGRKVKKKRRIVCDYWEPRNGDKLKFRYEDGTYRHVAGQVGIRVGTAYAQPRTYIDPLTGNLVKKIEATEQGLVYWLDKWERANCVVHKHMIEDGPYWEPRFAGRIHGVGIRDRIYWSWYAMIECLQRVVEYLDRAAFGIEIWPYPAQSEKAKNAASNAAKSAMGGGRTVILAPISDVENPEMYLPRLIEPGLGGVNTTIDIIRTYWGHKIKRYILGQTLTSEADATGLGSGVADAHLATLADIVEYDSTNLEETLTNEFLRPLQLQNFPDSDDIDLLFRINTEAADPLGKMQGLRAAWEMGLEIKAADVADVIGVTLPDPDDMTLTNPQIAAAMAAAEQPQGMPPQEPGAEMGAEPGPFVDDQQMPVPESNAEAQPFDIGRAIDLGSAGGSAMGRRMNGQSFADRFREHALAALNAGV